MNTKDDAQWQRNWVNTLVATNTLAKDSPNYLRALSIADKLENPKLDGWQDDYVAWLEAGQPDKWGTKCAEK